MRDISTHDTAQNKVNFTDAEMNDLDILGFYVYVIAGVKRRLKSSTTSGQWMQSVAGMLSLYRNMPSRCLP